MDVSFHESDDEAEHIVPVVFRDLDLSIQAADVDQIEEMFNIWHQYKDTSNNKPAKDVIFELFCFFCVSAYEAVSVNDNGDVVTTNIKWEALVEAFDQAVDNFHLKQFWVANLIAKMGLVDAKDDGYVYPPDFYTFVEEVKEKELTDTFSKKNKRALKDLSLDEKKQFFIGSRIESQAKAVISAFWLYN